MWERDESFGEFEQHSIVSKGGDHRLEPGVVSGSERPATTPIAGALRSARSRAVRQFGGSLPGLLDHGHDLGAQGRIQPSAHFVGREPGLAAFELAEIADGKTGACSRDPKRHPLPGGSEGLPNLKSSRHEGEFADLILDRCGVAGGGSGSLRRLEDALQEAECLQDRLLSVRGSSGQPPPAWDERPSGPSEVLAQVPDEGELGHVASELIQQGAGGLREGHKDGLDRLFLDVRRKWQCS
jgi:hypothetical protein